MKCTIDDIFYVLYTQVYDINTGGLSIPMYDCIKTADYLQLYIYIATSESRNIVPQ